MAQDDFMPDLADAERIRIMEQNADTIEDTSYFRRLSEDEVSLRREDYSDKSIELGDLEDELASEKARINGKIKPIKEEKKELLKTIRTKQEKVKGKLFHFADHDKKQMITYTEKGQFHASRKLRPDEQINGNVFQMPKAS